MDILFHSLNIDIRAINYDDILLICKADDDESERNIAHLNNQLKNQDKLEFEGRTKMELVLQPTSETCGQACIAMITGKDIEEVIRDMKTNGPTSIGQLIEILDYYGVKHAEKNTRISKKNPTPYEYSILTVHTNEGYTHWSLLFDNKYYDPEFGLIDGEYTYGKITSFLGIYK